MISETVRVPTADVALTGDLVVPDRPRGVILFAHGSGSSRLSPRNRAVAAGLRRAGLGTLLLDLLTEDEEREDAATGRHRFDVVLLARRLVDAVDWPVGGPASRGCRWGCSGRAPEPLPP